MTFRITIEVPDSKLTATLKQLDGHKCAVENVDVGTKWATASPRKLQRVGPHNRIMLGSKSEAPTEGSLSAEIVSLVKKYEAKHGAGAITRKQLTKQLDEYSNAPGAAIGLAIKQDIIRGIADG